MPLAQWNAGRMLASLPPYSEVICVVSHRSRRGGAPVVGLARSDPYLSTATPLGQVSGSTPGRLSRALRRALSFQPVGALVLGLPLRVRPLGVTVLGATARDQRDRRSLALRLR